jgi:hypothetical protein
LEQVCDDGAEELPTLLHHTIRFDSEIAITISGLSDEIADYVAARWCAELTTKKGEGRSAAIDIGFESRADRTRESVSHNQSFGTWRATINPATGRSAVVPLRGDGAPSDDFFKAVDLCVTFALALRGGVVVHGAAFTVGGHGILAAGGSGSGKSTITAAALRRGAQVASDDLVLVTAQASGRVQVESLRRELYLREPGRSALPRDLQADLEPIDVLGEARWRLRPKAVPGSFTNVLKNDRLWLLSVDRRLRESRREDVAQAAALAWLMHGISGLFLTAAFRPVRERILEVLGRTVVSCPATRIRLGRDLLVSPAGCIDRLLCPEGKG